MSLVPMLRDKINQFPPVPTVSKSAMCEQWAGQRFWWKSVLMVLSWPIRWQALVHGVLTLKKMRGFIVVYWCERNQRTRAVNLASTKGDYLSLFARNVRFLTSCRWSNTTVQHLSSRVGGQLSRKDFVGCAEGIIPGITVSGIDKTRATMDWPPGRWAERNLCRWFGCKQQWHGRFSDRHSSAYQ